MSGPPGTDGPPTALLDGELLDHARSASRMPLGIRFKLAYAAGACVESITTVALTYFAFFYLTAVCGLSGTLAGASSLIALCVDAFADPLIGLLSDNTRSRLGRRVPYMLASIAPIAIAFGLLFTIPHAMQGLTLFGYATALMLVLRFSLSLFILPYAAVGAEVTDDYTDRSRIVAWRIAFGTVGTFIGVGLGLAVYMKGADGLLNRAAYGPFGWTCAGLIVIAALIASFSSRSVLHRLHTSEPVQGPIIRQFIRELGEVFRTPSFSALFISALIFFVAQGAAGALMLHANRYFWTLSASGVQTVITGIVLGPIVGVPLAFALSRIVEKRTITIACIFIFSISQFYPPVLKIMGLMPPAGPALITILFCNALVQGAALVGAGIGFQSMMADATDEHQFLFGVRREGLFFAGLTLSVKAATGLGSFIAGTALDLIHFPSSVASAGVAALAPETIRNLGLIAGPLPAALTVLSPIALFTYRLTRTRHAEIQAALRARPAAASQ